MIPNEKVKQLCVPKKLFWSANPPWMYGSENWIEKIGDYNLLMVLNGGNMPTFPDMHPLMKYTVPELAKLGLRFKHEGSSYTERMSLTVYCESMPPRLLRAIIENDTLPALYQYQPRFEWVNSLRKIEKLNVHLR